MSEDWKTLGSGELLGRRFHAETDKGKVVEGELRIVRQYTRYILMGLREQKLPVIKVPTSVHVGKLADWHEPIPHELVPPFTCFCLEQT